MREKPEEQRPQGLLRVLKWPLHSEAHQLSTLPGDSARIRETYERGQRTITDHLVETYFPLSSPL